MSEKRLKSLELKLLECSGRLERLERKTYFLNAPAYTIIMLLLLYLFSIKEFRDYIFGLFA